MELPSFVARFALAVGLFCSSSSALHNISLLILAPNPTKTGEPNLVMNGWKAGPALYPATRLAIERINDNETLLPDFHLQSIEADTACSATIQTFTSVVRHVFQESQNQVVGIIGPGCSEAALTVSNLTRRYEVSILHITQGNDPQLEEKFRNTTFASVSSALFYVRSFITLMQNRKWKKIATLVDVSRNYFQQTHARFRDEVKKNGYQLLASNSITVSKDQSVIPLQEIINSKARIIFVFAQKEVAAQIMCYAFFKNMIYPDYQWIFHDRRKKDFINDVKTFTANNIVVNCSKEEMINATKRIVLNRFNLINDRKTRLPLFNISYEDYLDDYKIKYEEYERETGLVQKFTEFANSYHDAVWAFALALDNASKHGVDLKTYKYGNSTATKIIAASLFQVQFTGMSGYITFRKETRSPRSFINIFQIVDGNEELIGMFDDSAELPEKKLVFNYPNEELEFIKDSYETGQDRIHIAFGMLIILVTLGLAMITVFLQMANIMCYNYHSIKATSPNINHLIFSGCYLFMIAILVMTIRDTFAFNNDDISSVLYSILCNTLTWCFSLGYSLIFGTVCAKTWRVYRLFKHFQNQSPGMCLSDDYLITHVMILLAIDICICITWNVVDPWIHYATQDEFPTTISEKSIVIIRSDCMCKHADKWIATMVAYKGAITIGLVALTILNRQVKRKNFQHTRKINILIYGTILAVCMGLPLYFLLKHKSIYIGFVMLFLILMSTLVLCLLVIFLPPVVPVLKIKLTKSEQKPKCSREFSTNSLFS